MLRRVRIKGKIRKKVKLLGKRGFGKRALNGKISPEVRMEKVVAAGTSEEFVRKIIDE